MKFCIIGLGRFGYQLAVSLAENGMDVMGVDENESIIASIRDQITQGVCIEIMDEASLRSIGVDEMDVVIVSMGEDFAQSILITAILKKRLKVERVIARAIHEVHKEILTLIGADHVVLPEKEIGIKLADTLSSPFTDIIRMSHDFSINQMRAPLSFIGNTIRDLRLFEEYNIHCIAIKKDERIYAIDPDHIVTEGDKLIFAGNNDDLTQLAKL